MQYRTESGIIVTDRRHSRSDTGGSFDDPRQWTPNQNIDPPPPDQPGVGPNMSEGFGNQHVMYPANTQLPQTSLIGAPPVMPWSGWPVEWNTPLWGDAAGIGAIIGRVSLVFGCIDLNSSILSTMPPYRLMGDDVIDSLPWMANPQPEVYNGWTEALKEIVMCYWGAGEAFLWATNRYADGTVRNFVMLNPAWVDVEMIGQVRRYGMAGVDITDDCLHLRYASWPGLPHGFGPLAALATNLFGVAALESYQANLAARGGIPWGVLTAPGNLTSDQATDMRTAFVNARLSAIGAPAVLSGGVTLSPMTLNPKDMALIELRSFDEIRISTLLGVPSLLMGLPTGDRSMTYRNAEGIYDFHWRAYLRPKAATLMEAISHWALPSTQSIELNRDEYVRPNFQERVGAYNMLFNMYDPATGQRAMTIDEIRAAERLAALDPSEAQTIDPLTGQPVPIEPPPIAQPKVNDALSPAIGQGQVTN
jgi:HK97 family phage portal protein